MLLSALLGCSTQYPYLPQQAVRDDYQFSWTEADGDSETARVYPNVANLLESEQPMLALYREDMTHRAVEEFFSNLVGSKEIALPILYYAEQHDLSLSLVFSLVWVESRFEPTAINQNASSIDRGLFQLNNRSFPHLDTQDFFDTHVNARHGTSYLRFSLDQVQDWRTAIAVYNAGLRRVRANQIPASTQVHVSRVAAYKNYVEQRFHRYITDRFPLPPGIRVADDSST